MKEENVGLRRKLEDVEEKNREKERKREEKMKKKMELLKSTDKIL